MVPYEYITVAIIIFTMFTVAVGGVSNIIITSIGYSGSQNEKAYAESLFESMLTTTGTPGDWGSEVGNDTYPNFLGLAASYSSPYDLDPDKVLRLSEGNPLYIPYRDSGTPTDAVRMLGAQGNYDFRLRFLLPLNVSRSLGFNAQTNILRLPAIITDIYGRPVPLVRFDLSYTLYYDKTDLFTGLNQTKSKQVKVLLVADASNSTIVYNILTLSYYGMADELGRYEFYTNLTSTLIDIGVAQGTAATSGQNVAVIQAVGKASLGGISVPFVVSWGKQGINVQTISGVPAAGYLVRGRGQKLVVIYDPTSSTGEVLEDFVQGIDEALKKGHPYRVETVAVSPDRVAISIVYDLQFLNKYYVQSYKNGGLKVFELPLIASGAPLQSVITFKTKGNPDNPKLLIFDRVISFVDPLLMVAPPLGSATGLEYGGTPDSGIPVIKLQRMVSVEGYSYISEFWLWRR